MFPKESILQYKPNNSCKMEGFGGGLHNLPEGFRCFPCRCDTFGFFGSEREGSFLLGFE